MSHCADATHLSPDERVRELSSILAAGVLRLRKRRLLGGEHAQIPQETYSESAAEGLDLSGETVLSVLSG